MLIQQTSVHAALHLLLLPVLRSRTVLYNITPYTRDPGQQLVLEKALFMCNNVLLAVCENGNRNIYVTALYRCMYLMVVS